MLPQQPSDKEFKYSYGECSHDTTYPASAGVVKCAMCHKVMVNLHVPDDVGGMQGEVDRLRQREAQLEREIDRLKSYFVRIQELLAPVLLDPEGYVSIHGSDADKEYIQKAIEIINREAR